MKYIFYLLFCLVLLWLGGLGYFIYSLSNMAPPTDEKTDGIVVLTGGKDRLKAAADLLEQGLAGKLFISGVNAQVTDGELRGLLGISKKLADCCIESGTMAQNTVGNAEEISLWVARGRLSSIRVVTSLEHMPRTLVEMRRIMPGTRMISHPVGQWRPDRIRFIPLVREYSKYLVSLFRNWFLDIGW